MAGGIPPGIGHCAAAVSYTHLDVYKRQMGMREMIAKFIVQIVIVIINYVFSKLFIFRKQKK